MASLFIAIHLSKSYLSVWLSVYCLVGTSSAYSDFHFVKIGRPLHRSSSPQKVTLGCKRSHDDSLSLPTFCCFIKLRHKSPCLYIPVWVLSVLSAVLSKNADFGSFFGSFELARNYWLFRGFGAKNAVFMRLCAEDETSRNWHETDWSWHALYKTRNAFALTDSWVQIPPLSPDLRPQVFSILKFCVFAQTVSIL